MAVYRGKIDLVDMREISQAGSLFTWVRYAEDINGKGISDNPEGKNYIGFAYNKTSPSPPPLSEDFSEEDLASLFIWSLYKGTNGHDGVGIVKVEHLYAFSDNGTIPPIDIVSLTILDNNTMAFPEDSGISFITNNSVLMAQGVDEELFKLTIKDGQIIGVGVEWTETVPIVPSGQYLWTKTIYYYSNGEKTVNYASNYQGLDGQDANIVKFKLNQKEILKFVDDDSSERVIISPEDLVISVVKEDIHTWGEQQYITQLNENEFVVEICDLKSNDWKRIENFDDNIFITIDGNSNFVVKLQALADLAIIKEDRQVVKKDYGSTKDAALLLRNTECLIRVGYIHVEEGNRGVTNTYNLNDFISVRYNMTKDMASLSVNAHNIVASMQDSKLIFGAHGLTVQNGAFKIVGENNGKEEDLLYASEGNLCIKGNLVAATGTFSGKLEAASGSFSGELIAATGQFKGELVAASGSFAGEITAKSGKIGGFQITDEKMVSTESVDNPAITLDGTKGTIIANKIILGTGAEIKDYITIGKVDKTSQEGDIILEQYITLRKPTQENNNFIEVAQGRKDDKTTILSLNSEGTILVGNNDNQIIIDGSTSTMMSKGYIDGSNFGWKISNNNSVFNNVTVRGSIRASVLEYEEIQVVGGMLLVRPGSKILSASYNSTNKQTTLKVEDGRYFRAGDYCRLDSQTLTAEKQSGTEEWVGIFQNWYKIISIEGNNVIVSGEVTGSIGSSLVSFGQIDKNNNIKDNVGIFINGSSGESFFSPQAITVFETNFDNVNNNNQQPELKRKVVIGRLPIVDWKAKDLEGSYGLYAENAYLKGALVTQFNNGSSYAGINTIYENEGEDNCPTTKRYAEHFKDQTGAPIIFWGGAAGFTKKEIEESTFLIDKNGNLVANSGFFKGTIISEATIEASTLKTAKLIGSGKEYEPDAPALIIEDVNKGIVFASTKDAEEGEEQETISLFELQKEGINTVLPLKIGSNFSITANGMLTASSLNTKGLEIGERYIQSVFGSSNSKITFDSGLAFFASGKQSLKMQADKVEVEQTLLINKNINYGGVAEYKPAKNDQGEIIGYDLYIEEKE